MRFFQTPEFQQLKLYWYQKLKEDGFEDQEDVYTNKLKKFHSHLFNQYYSHQKNGVDQITFRKTYYDQAVDFLYSYPFKNPLHKTIWELHASSISIRKIALMKHLDRSKIFRIIKDLKKKMREIV